VGLGPTFRLFWEVCTHGNSVCSSVGGYIALLQVTCMCLLGLLTEPAMQEEGGVLFILCCSALHALYADTSAYGRGLCLLLLEEWDTWSLHCMPCSVPFPLNYLF
jgi:hypothetical protein